MSTRKPSARKSRARATPHAEILTPIQPDSRRNFWIRTVAGVTGDVAIGVALSSACIWVIQSAALGLFLSFLLWILALLVGLAISQYVLHPVIAFTLSDAKLDQGMAALSSLANATADLGKYAPIWRHVRRGMTRFAT